MRCGDDGQKSDQWMLRERGPVAMENNDLFGTRYSVNSIVRIMNKELSVIEVAVKGGWKGNKYALMSLILNIFFHFQFDNGNEQVMQIIKKTKIKKMYFDDIKIVT